MTEKIQSLQDTYIEQIGNGAFDYDHFLEFLLSNRVPYKKKILNRNICISTENKPFKSIYFIDSGVVSCKKEGNIIGFLGGKHIIGLSNPYTKDNAFYTTKTVQSTCVYEFDRAKMLAMLLSYQFGWLFLYANNHDKEVMLVDKTQLLKEPAEYRFVTLLKEIARLFGKLRNETIYIPAYFSKTMLASYANLSTRSINTLCNDLVQKGVLVFEEESPALA
ncbi:putative cyclic nucleotide-binding proteins (Crp-like) [Listeria weihenstephanensis FSL R9-0317]|uniref:Crp/Fnr family transcriptional regulator n=1 Tax=Listeria weihenstephanensis TaxID=1006155 RepID=A0A1S7FS96_9LIST|nr:Crp/Fnr family transcriptional regulator [Listeria weihenstephanensis]AQY50316.1 hypothetical protein UE46_04260 [Listeria weihenstephanensis]EUJ40944.1 putative cyclic nucleotide-binding proteins (Crp-like) [Listeria weihenstephanensis FSL R9-0317]MBC1501210.1 Crp/Fnr family transcriptional regulator [Listeria weihenstephanensis]